MKKCLLCNAIFVPIKRQHYCNECRETGKARKAILHKYNTSSKNKIVQKKWYYSDLERTKKNKNKYNRSEKGKISKRKYYEKNAHAIIQKTLTTQRDEIISRTKAHTIAKKQKIPPVCVICFTAEKIVVHHIDRNPFNNDLDNLVYLCSSCHGKEHEALNLRRSNLPFIGDSSISIKKIINNPRLISPLLNK